MTNFYLQTNPGNIMGKTRAAKPTILESDFAENADTRHGHISQTRRLNGDAIRELQTIGYDKGQATAMLYPKGGSRCRGLAP